jgi:hypothetical protein
VIRRGAGSDHADLTALLGKRVVLGAMSGIAKPRKDTADHTT